MKVMNTRACASMTLATSRAKLANMVQTRGVIAFGSADAELKSGAWGSCMGCILVRRYGFEIRRFLRPGDLECRIRSDPPPHHPDRPSDDNRISLGGHSCHLHCSRHAHGPRRRVYSYWTASHFRSVPSDVIQCCRASS